MNLVYPREIPLFRIALALSLLLWVALILGTLGLALLYLLLGYVAFLFAHSAFISHVKGTGVRVTESQYPDLYARLVRCSDKVGLEERPELYLLRTDFFNALATKFFGRYFIVLFTDVVDALEKNPGALDFYIGHELGHIHRKHLRWNIVLFPAMLLPVLGTAYRRAQEYTCDRYGAFCCENDDDARTALAAIAAGNSRNADLNPDAYQEQIASTTGFWMSFHELTGDYPWLTKRLASALAFRNGREVRHPRRSALAWMLSMIVPRFGAGGAASLLIVIVLLGVLAAVAIPAYQDYVQRASNEVAYQAATPLTDAVAEYAQANQQWPTSLMEVGAGADPLADPAGSYEISIYDEGVIGVDVGEGANGERSYIVLEPVVEDGEISWVCYGQNLPEQMLPEACR